MGVVDSTRVSVSKPRMKFELRQFRLYLERAKSKLDNPLEALMLIETVQGKIEDMEREFGGGERTGKD